MNKKIAVPILIIVSAVSGALGYKYYLENNREWKVTNLVPIYEKALTEEYNVGLSQLYAEMKNIKIELFRENNWPSFKSEWIEYLKIHGDIKKIEDDSQKIVEEGYDFWVKDVDSIRRLIYLRDPKVIEKKGQIEAYRQNKDESKFFNKEIGFRYRVDGKQAMKKIICNFVDTEGNKMAGSSRFIFEVPPYQEVEKRGVFASEVQSINCYAYE